MPMAATAMIFFVFISFKFHLFLIYIIYILRPKKVRTRHLLFCIARLSSCPILVKLNTIDRPANILFHCRTTAPRPVMMVSGK